VVILAFKERDRYIRCQVCKVLSLTIAARGSYENPRENHVGAVSGARMCHEQNMRATTSNFSFAKTERPEKSRYDLYDVSLLSSEPGPDPNIIRGARPGPCRPPATSAGWVEAVSVPTGNTTQVARPVASHFTTSSNKENIICRCKGKRVYV
jgi:hypothetical protein